MTFTPILHAPQVAPNQNQKEATINTALAVIEAACNDRQTISLATGNHVLTTDEFTKSFHTVFSGHTVARTVTIPNTVRFFAFSNSGAANITVQITGSSGLTLVVPAAKRVLVISDGVDVVAISQGVSALAELSDVIGAADASNKQVLAYDAASSTWIPQDKLSTHGFWTPSGTLGSSARLYRFAFAQATRFLSNFDGSKGGADTAATASADLKVLKNGAQVGSIHFAAGNATPSFSTDVGSGSTTVTYAIGDVMEIVAPVAADATLAGAFATLLGVVI